MRHFIITLDFKVPFEDLGETVPRHRVFLQEGYDQGLLLMSGPRVPRIGGVVVARAESQEQLEAFFSKDPYKLEGLATHTLHEFTPVKSQDFIETWIESA